MVSSQFLNVSNVPAERTALSISFAQLQLYKIYVSSEVNTLQKKFSLEIIDGFLRGNEKLHFIEHMLISDHISMLTFEISTANQLNTYFKTESFNYVNSNHKIFVVVKKQQKIVGYQYIGLDNEIIPEIDQKILSKLL